MAIHLIKANALLVEPCKTGTTWMQHALRAAGIETAQPETLLQCCLRHSFPTNYAGTYDAVISPVRHPDSWLVSFYDYFAARSPENWQAGRFYAQKCFGHMPPTFAEFVAQATPHVRDYWEGFLMPATHVICQEHLRDDFAAVLTELGYDPEQLEKMDDVPWQNVHDEVSSWDDVPESVRLDYWEQTSWISEAHYEQLAGHGGQGDGQGSAGSEAVEPVAEVPE